MTTDFRFYLNKSGIRGPKGEKGDKGYSPSISEEVNTLDDYRLRINNEFDSFVTDNLRGSNYFDASDPNGTYLRYNQNTKKAYVGGLDQATGVSIGGARLANNSDIETFSENTIVTPALFADSLSKLIINNDGNLSIVQDEISSKTKLNLSQKVVHPNLFYTDNSNYLQTGDLRYHAPIVISKGTLPDTGRRGAVFSFAYDNSHFSISNNELKINNSIIDKINTSKTDIDNLSSDLNIEKTTRFNADNQLQSAIDAERTERETQDAALQNQISSIGNNFVDLTTNQTINGIKFFNGDIKAKAINFVASNNQTTSRIARYSGSLRLEPVIDGERIIIGDNDKANSSIQMNNDTNFLSIPTVNNTDKLLTQNNVEAGDNVTIEQTTDGIKISSTGGGVVPENVMTTDTNQNVTGEKTFKGESLRIGNDDGYKNLAKYESETHWEDPEHTRSFTDATVMPGAIIANVHKPYLHGTFPDVEMIYSPVLSQNDVDNQTIKVVDGKLHADFSEIGDEVNALAGRMNTVENELGDLTERVDELQLYKFPNATIEGDPIINNGQVSNFSTTNFLRFPFEFKTEGRTWLLNGSFDTKPDVTTQQNIIDSLASVALAVRNGRLVLALSTNGTSFDLGEHLSMSDIEPNTKYYYRLSFNGIQYILSISTNKQEWLPEIIVASDRPIASKPMTISSPGHPFKGTINLNDWDLTVGNVLVWQGMDDVGIASRMDVNASNITQTGIDKLKELLLGDIEALVDTINVNYNPSSQSLAATPMLLSLEPNELDVENSFTYNKSKAVFNEDIQITPLKEESYDDDTDIDLGGNA